MSATLFLYILLGYFLGLFIIANRTAKGATMSTFFVANREAPWYIVAFGMVGTTLSGVTFISVPGAVGQGAFGYFQIVLGYFFGYLIISRVLLPIYYKYNLISIYGYLEQTFWILDLQNRRFLFLISRTIGASFRLFLIALVLQVLIFRELGLSFEVTVFIAIALIWFYTFRGGMKTIIWTDTLQTLFMLLAVVLSIYIIFSKLNLSLAEGISLIEESKYAQVFSGEMEKIISSKCFLQVFLLPSS